MKVLITGGAGYIGIELAYFLCRQPWITSVTIYDSLSRANADVFAGERKFHSNKVQFVQGDILDGRTLSRYLSGSDAVVHLAAQVPNERGFFSAHSYEQVNHWGIGSLCDALLRLNEKKLVINLSTVAVLGRGEINLYEADPDPSDFYAVSKYRGELRLLSLEQDPRFTIVNARSGSVYGYSKNLRTDLPLNKMVFDANFFGKVEVYGDPSLSAPHIYIDDLVAWLAGCLQKPPVEGNCAYPNLLNVGSADILDVLTEIIPELEWVEVDVGNYVHSLRVHGSNATWLNEERETLKRNLQKFLSSFTFGLSDRSG